MPDLRSIAGSFANGRPVPGQLTTDPAVMPSDADLAKIADIAKARLAHFADMNALTLRNQGLDPDEEDEYLLLEEIRERKGMLEGEQARLRALFRWLDNLYYPDTISEGGPDHWPLKEEQKRKGVTHISVNTPPVYVDIPASLQAVPPIENYVASSVEDDEREAAGRRERLYFQWKEEDEFELKVHKGCLVKELYGFTFGRPTWDAIEKRPTVRIIDSPENLYVGWGDSDYSRIDWTIYCYGLSPQGVREVYGLEVEAVKDAKGDSYHPYVTKGTHADPIESINPKSQEPRAARLPTAYEDMQVEVYDYWYKKPASKGKRPEIWNAIYVGNALVKNARHREYEEIPYIPLPNTFIPGFPYGRPALYDIAQLIREKDERITNAAAMIQSIVGGQMWQITGPEAPDEVPPNAIPKPNKVAAPGPGNELRAIQPFVPQFAVEDFNKRLDAEMEVVSGLNELLLGRAPATILGSSKAIAALVSNYEARIRMKRDLLYQWRKKVWRMVAKIWEEKDRDVREIIDGNYRLDVKAPELTPRDELEVAQMAINLKQNRLWSAERAMDRTGVEDPGEEKSLIRNEQTDPALEPAAVQAQAQLLLALQSAGIQPPQASVNQAQNAARTLNPPAAGGQSLNAPENQGNAPQESLPANAQQGSGLAQTMLQEGEASGRILTQAPINGAPTTAG